MSFLPEKTMLGQLEIIEVYVSHDKPLLFSCKNKSDHIFIANYIDELDTKEVWFYAPISLTRFKSLLNEKIQLRDVFSDAEDGFVYQVEIPYNKEQSAEVNVTYCSDISDDDLPDSDQTIKSENTNLSIKDAALQKEKEVLDFVLTFPDESIKEAPIGNLGEIMYSLQELIYAIGQIKLGKSENHIIQSDVKDRAKLAISGTFDGSFGMRLEGITYYEDEIGLGESLLERCLNEFTQLINIGADKNELPAKLNRLNSKTASKYIDFLKASSRIDIAKLHIDWASPNKDTQVGEIERSAMFNVLKVIEKTKFKEETEIIVNVKLAQIHFDNDTLLLKEINSKQKYKCSIAESAKADVLTVSRLFTYVAIIQDYVTISPAFNKEKHEYELLSLKLQENLQENLP